jgi:hypothetical protein
MSEYPAPQWQDPNIERTALFEEWWISQTPDTFVNQRTACHLAFLAGWRANDPRNETYKLAVKQTAERLMAALRGLADEIESDLSAVLAAHRPDVLSGEEKP